MASISRDPNGHKRILFVDSDGTRRSIRLGKLPIKAAETIKHHVETLLACRTSGTPWPATTARWVGELSDDMAEKLARVGLIDRRPAEPLGAYLARWMDGRRQYKATTRDTWSRTLNDLVRFFGADRPLATLDHQAAAKFRLHLIERGLCDTTIQTRLQHARLFFRLAVCEGALAANPFEHVRHKGGNPAERRSYVPREHVERVIRQCPNATWRLLVVLARYAGLRTPSEPFSLRWSDVLWDEDRLIVRSPKTGDRAVPLFPEIRKWLTEAWEQAPDGAEYVIPEQMRQRAMGPHGWRNANLRTTLAKIIKRAGLAPWPRLWHSLRASCETDLVREYPLPVVAKWLGNTSMIAMRHYVDVTDEHFRQAAQGSETCSGKAAQKAAQQTPEMGASGRNERKPESEKRGFSMDFCTLQTGANTLADGEGFEPPVPERVQQFSRLPP
ncbi:hypothetical protein JCM19992_22120 [Thermostilla marina]